MTEGSDPALIDDAIIEEIGLRGPNIRAQVPCFGNQALGRRPDPGFVPEGQFFQ